VLLVNGKPKPVQKQEVPQTPTLAEFAGRFVDGYAKANRLKPSGIAAKKTVLSVHLIPQLGDKRLDQITTEDVQRLKAALADRAAKTVNNVLTVLSVMLRTAVEWDVITRVPCAIKLLQTTKSAASSTTSTRTNDSWRPLDVIRRRSSLRCSVAKRDFGAAR
jgi:hypothetical protein